MEPAVVPGKASDQVMGPSHGAVTSVAEQDKLAPAPPKSLASKLTPSPTSRPVSSPAVRDTNDLPVEVKEGKLIEQRVSERTANGQFRRVSVYQTAFKYPFLRVEEFFTKTADGMEKSVSRNVMVADHFIVRLKRGMTEEALTQHLATLGLSIRRHLPNSAFYTAALKTPTIAAYDAALKAIETPPGPAVYAEPDFIAQASGAPVIPNDTDFAELWNLHNTGQSGGVVGADVKASEAWSTTTGSADIVVAVIDTGIDYNHPDLAANVWTNAAEIAGNGLDDDGDGYVDDVRGWNFVLGNNNPLDDNGHGSHTSGTLGAVGGNALGVTGVCQHVKIMPLKFLSATGSGANTDAIEAILYATAHHALLTSNSWGGGGFSQAMKDAIDLANLADVGFIAAAGNSANDNDQVPSYPSSFQSPNVIAVAATDASDAITYFSSYGKTSVHVAAPGLAIYSTTKNGGYATMSGTSMATPHVSGACALLKAANPNLSFAQIKQSLLTQADAKPTLKNKIMTGGRLNIDKALVPATAPFVVIGDTVIDDALGGNADGILSPGEGALIKLKLRNIGALTANGVSAVLALKTPNALVSFTQTSASFGDIASNANGETLAPFQINVDPLMPTPSDLAFTLTVTDADAHSWTLDLTLHVYTVATLSGTVTRLTGGAPVEGATIDIKGTVNTTTVTAADGTYSIPLVDGAYTLVAKAAGLNPSSPQTVVLPPSQPGVNFVLGHSDLLVSATALSATLHEDHTATQTFTVTNNGDLPLTYRVEEAPDNTIAAAARNRPTAASWLQTPLFANTARKPQEGYSSLMPAPSISASAATQSLLHKMPFDDGFEVGDWSANWYPTYGNDNIREIDSTQHARGSKSLHLQNIGPDDGHFTGVHGEFDWFTSPGYVSFWVRPGADDAASSYVVLTDVYFIWLFDWAWFFANDNGRFYINADVGGNQTFEYSPETWYHVELRNVNWSTHKFDYYVNDALIQAGVPMRNPDYCYGLAYAIIYNYSAGVDAWWDDIKVYADALNWLSVTTPTGSIAPGQTKTFTVTYNANGVNAGTYHGNLVLKTNAAIGSDSTLPVTMVVEQNVVPTADSQSLVMDEDTLQFITLTGSDSDSPVLTPRITKLPTKGQLYQTADGITPGALISATGTAVTNALGQVIFRPAANGNGTPYTSFEYVMRDTRADSPAATVTIAVNALDDAPVAVGDHVTVLGSAPVQVVAVLANDLEYDGETLTLLGATNGQHGTTVANADGTVTYTLNQELYVGSDSFTYTITDGHTNATGTVFVTIPGPRLSLTPVPGAAALTQPVVLSFQVAPADAVIRFATDGSEPTETSPALGSDGTLRLERSTNVKARAFKAGNTSELVVISVVIADTDTTGLPDWWQQQYLGALGNDPMGDNDRDGRSNLAEFIAGTDPAKGDSFSAKVTADPAHPGQPTLKWDSVEGRFYKVESSTDLATWTNASEFMSGTGAQMSWSEPTAGTHKFYRISVRLP
jgi:large repetitive protein